MSQGGVMYYRKYQDPNPVESYTDRVGWWGWKGTGGSVMQWHRKHRVAFGYAPTKIRYPGRRKGGGTRGGK